MSQDDKAYDLIRAWRRGEINGNQFDFRLEVLGLPESYCLAIARERDAEYLTMMAKEFAIMVSVLTAFMLYGANHQLIPAQASRADSPRTYSEPSLAAW